MQWQRKKRGWQQTLSQYTGHLLSYQVHSKPNLTPIWLKVNDIQWHMMGNDKTLIKRAPEQTNRKEISINVMKEIPNGKYTLVAQNITQRKKRSWRYILISVCSSSAPAETGGWEGFNPFLNAIFLNFLVKFESVVKYVREQNPNHPDCLTRNFRTTFQLELTRTYWKLLEQVKFEKVREINRTHSNFWVLGFGKFKPLKRYWCRSETSLS